MLNSGDGFENGKKTTAIGLISKTKQQQLWFSLPLLLHDYNEKLSTYTFCGGYVVFSHQEENNPASVRDRFLSHCRSVKPYWPLTFLIFSVTFAIKFFILCF